MFAYDNLDMMSRSISRISSTSIRFSWVVQNVPQSSGCDTHPVCSCYSSKYAIFCSRRLFCPSEFLNIHSTNFLNLSGTRALCWPYSKFMQISLLCESYLVGHEHLDGDVDDLNRDFFLYFHTFGRFTVWTIRKFNFTLRESSFFLGFFIVNGLFAGGSCFLQLFRLLNRVEVTFFFEN